MFVISLYCFSCLPIQFHLNCPKVILLLSPYRFYYVCLTSHSPLPSLVDHPKWKAENPSPFKSFYSPLFRMLVLHVTPHMLVPHQTNKASSKNIYISTIFLRNICVRYSFLVDFIYMMHI